MDTKTIDQTASELELHRVLYVIKFLRAIVLHVILIVVAALLYFLTGVHNAYPLASAFIQALLAQAVASRREYGPLGGLLFPILLVAALVAALAFLVWMY